MEVEISVFLGFLFLVYLASVLVIDYVKTNRIVNIDKKTHLRKRTCDICSSSHFVSVFFRYWRCPLCQSINREVKNDNRDRDSRG